jgi:hypothetical protein
LKIRSYTKLDSSAFKRKAFQRIQRKLRKEIKLDGQYIRKAFLQPEMQAEVGTDGYDIGAKILTDFFKDELIKFNTPELHPLGREIIECFLRDASLQDYIELITMKY